MKAGKPPDNKQNTLFIVILFIFLIYQTCSPVTFGSQPITPVLFFSAGFFFLGGMCTSYGLSSSKSSEDPEKDDGRGPGWRGLTFTSGWLLHAPENRAGEGSGIRDLDEYILLHQK